METPLHHFFTSRTDPRTLDVLTRGPLAPYLSAYAQRLHDEGYATQSGESQLRVLGHFNRWLERQHIVATAVTSSTLGRYVRSRRKSWEAAQRRRCRALPRVGHASTRSPCVRFTAADRAPGGRAAVSAVPPTGTQSGRGDDYQLRANRRRVSRGVFSHWRSQTSIRSRPAEIPTCPPPGRSHHHEARHDRGDRAALVSRYSPARGNPHRPGRCVPTIATWSLSTVPKFLPADQIERVLDAADRDTRGRETQLRHPAAVGTVGAARRRSRGLDPGRTSTGRPA